CEAMVPIRDPNLIGRKIDCPQCKYRFVVEDPGAGDEAGEEPEEGAEAAQGKRGGSATAAKAKAGPRRRRGDDAAHEDAPSRRPQPKSSGSKGLVIGLVLGGVGLAIAAGVVAMIMMNSDDSGGGGSKSAANTTTTTPSGPSRPSRGDTGDEPGGKGGDAGTT